VSAAKGIFKKWMEQEKEKPALNKLFNLICFLLE
jgi:hypothetical protein